MSEAMSKRGAICGAVMAWVSGVVETTITTAGTPVKAAGAVSALGQTPFTAVDEPSLKITYDDVRARDCFLRFHGDILMAAGDSTVTVSIYKNGESIAGKTRTTATSSASFDFSYICPLEFGDELEVYLTNDINTTNITILSGSELSVLGC